MLCNKCGATLPEDAQFCGMCGETMVGADVAAVGDFAAVPAPKKNLKPLWLSLVALACVAALAVGAYFIFCYNSFQGLLDDYSALAEGDFSDLEEMAPPQVWDKLFKDKGVMIDSLVRDVRYADAIAAETEESMQSADEEMGLGLGKNIKWDINVICDHPLTGAEYGDLKQGLKDTYQITEVEDARLLHVEAELSGDADRYTQMAPLHAVKIDGEWYLVNFYSYTWEGEHEKEKEISVRFMAEQEAKYAIDAVKSDKEDSDDNEDSDDSEDWD